MFQGLTGENWNELLYTGLIALNGSVAVVFYYVSLNIIGNYVVLNLFLAILLSRFDEKDDTDSDIHNMQKASSTVFPVNEDLPETVYPIDKTVQSRTRAPKSWNHVK